MSLRDFELMEQAPAAVKRCLAWINPASNPSADASANVLREVVTRHAQLSAELMTLPLEYREDMTEAEVRAWACRAVMALAR